MSVRKPIVLILEDRSLVSLHYSEMIEDLGLEVAGPFATLAQAARWLDSHKPDMALLDYSLGKGTCAEFARRLASLGVPLVIMSAYPRDHAERDFPVCTWLTKSMQRDALREAVRKCLPTGCTDAS